MRVDLSLYVLVDPAQSRGRPLGEIAAAAARGGATLIQLRDKTGTTRELVDAARAIKSALSGSGVPLLINDRVDVALAADADGVHLGREDMEPRAARALLGAQAIIGITVRGEGDIAALVPEVSDYVCIGGVFATSSKNNPDAPVGVEGFARLARLSRAKAPAQPVGAIAGINERNAAEVIGAGADGIAIVSAVTSAADPEGAARRLRGIVDAARAGRGRAA
ncbi:MAG TPA: thiamine phosphate synthase [Xanthobacteraceae bacterium]|nr:thiamine phosphate synthase [Xanthobacteraceae bacterium]